MAIRISRNSEGNCINFVGTTNPAYWNACLSAQINAVNPSNIDIINDIRSEASSDTKYEFFDISYLEFADKDGNTFDTVQDCVDYINENANVVGVSDVGNDLSGVPVDFRLDQTSTSIIMDNGASFGVNTIKAVGDADGTIHIHAVGAGVPSGLDTPNEHKYYEKIDHTLVTIDSSPTVGGLSDVVNALNELFTVGAWTLITVTDPYSTMVADVSGTVDTYTLEGVTAIDPVGDDIFTNSSSGNYAGLKSVSTISRAGEYFTFDIRNEGQIGFGLVHSDTSYNDGYYLGSAPYADPSSFAVGNSAHYGYQFSHWFHPTPNGSWTNYGANTGYIRGPGWGNWESQDEWLSGDPVKVKVGLDENGFIAISTLQDDGLTWVMHARSSYPAPEGSQFHLGVKSANSVPRVYTVPRIHLLTSAPAMYFRYIESPDGSFDYPLFASETEVEYYDQNHSGTTGTGTWTQVVYPDDPTFTSWYRPDTGFTTGDTSAPSGFTFDGNTVNFTEIVSLANADLVPSSFGSQTASVNELSAVNIGVHPVGADWVTTVTNLPSGLTYDSASGIIHGTSPEVTDNNVNNPSDDYVATVSRTNSYGSSSGTLTITVVNLTAPATAISGFNHHTASDPLVDSDTMDDGSAIHMNNTVADGRRFVISQDYIETNILPSLQGAGDKYYIGLAVNGHSFATVEDADFDSAIVWEYETASSHTFKFINNGSVVNNIVISSLTDAFYDYAIEINGTSAWLIACNVNSINNEPSPADGGSFSHTYESTNLDETAPHTVHMAVVSTQGDFSATGLSQIDTPVVATSLTNWTKALNFSGGSERAQQVNSDYTTSALRMGGTSNLVTAPSAGQTVASGHPWATAIVFQTPNNTNNQHIWNSGEGAASGNDNMYLRMAGSNGELYFGWGREGGGYNEYHIGNFGGSYNQSTGQWWGIYIAHDGTRLSGANATAANLTSAFDIRLMGTNDVTPVFSNLYDVGSNPSNWVSTGARMDRAILGDFTIGGRGANRSFHGKVASMVVTTLRCGVAMPSDAEIQMMITDPMRWEQDYKKGQTFRQSLHTTTNTNWDSASGTTKAFATQIWLCGDGASDSYSNMIRNQVFPTDQNYTRLNLISMVSNDIENVTIGGLS
jgi:hypothetical protein